jgi:phage protein D
MATKAYQISFGGAAVSSDFYGDVVSLTVEESTMAAGVFTLKLVSRQQGDGSWGYLDDSRLALFNSVSIQVGFTGGGGIAAALGSLLGGGSGDGGGLSTVFNGYVTGFKFNLSSDSSNFVEVTGMDPCVLMNMEEKIATWPNMSDSDIALQIVGAYNVAIQADSTATTHQEDATTIVQRATDLQFVRELARRNGLEFYFETDDSGAAGAYFRAPQLDGAPQADLAVQFGDQTNLKSFSANMNGMRPLSVKAEQMDVQANSANSAQVSSLSLTKLGDKDAAALVSGPLGGLVTPKDALAQTLVLGPPTSDATELQTMAQAVRDEAGWFINASGEVNSDAYQAVLRPRRLVLVRGAGKAFSGKYYVTKVTHEIKAGGSYSQIFEARRNARGLDGSEQFGGSGSGLPIPGF